MTPTDHRFDRFAVTRPVLHMGNGCPSPSLLCSVSDESLWPTRLGPLAYLWPRVSLNNALQHQRVAFFDGVDSLADVVILDVARRA